MAKSGTSGCAGRLALFAFLAFASFVVGAAAGAALAHFDQDLVLAAWLEAQGVDLPAALYGE